MARRRSLVTPMILIALGAIFLYANLRPEVSPWPLIERWWPLLLIFLGLGKLWDLHRQRSQPEAAGQSWLTGGEIAVLVFLVLLVGFAVSRKSAAPREVREVETVERQGAEQVRVEIEMGAGDLQVASGASQLLEASFEYNPPELKPAVAYNVSGKQGQLSVRQSGGSFHFGRTKNDWELRLANDVPMELNVQLGAGRGELRLGGLSLSKLAVEMGAGKATVDLSGEWKNDLDARIEGGVGTATIRLPRNVGVRVRAEGGIGSINVRGLERKGAFYENEVYGKTPTMLRLNVQGGVGTINLETEP